MSDHTQDPELLPCPWCGEVPDISTDAAFRLTDGVKYGALGCCVTGPEVRTDYKDVPHWREAAIAAWNDRRSIPQGDDPAKAAAQGDELPPLPDFFKWWTRIETDRRKSLLVWARQDQENLHALLRQVFEGGAAEGREYSASCRAGEKADARDAALRSAVLAWWESRRPLRMDKAEHIANATVNRSGDAEQTLAKLAAGIVALSAQKGGEEGKGD